MLYPDAEEPDGTHLTQIRGRITEIIKIGTVHERKAMCEALIAELRIDRADTATPVIRVPLTTDDVPAILRTEARTAERKAVRACPPSVDLTMQNANTTITVPGHPLPTRLARSRAV